jgi:hypothetical protein
MRIRSLMLAAFCASVTLGAAAPAFADDGWDWRDRQAWREREWRRHEWREHEWREHAWRERQAWERRNYPPPAAWSYGYSAPPTVYYNSPGYYR